MSARGSGAGAAREQVLIFGEDAHDRDCVRILVAALRSDLPVKYKPLRKPLTLVKGMQAAKAANRNAGIVAAIRAANVSMPVRATLLHEDADALEPAHKELIASKETALRGAPGAVCAVVPAWTMETWLFLFPDAVAAYRSAWRSISQYRGRLVGNIRESLKAN